MTSTGFVFAAALATALATGLGALPFLFVRSVRAWWLGIANAIAAGLMLGATHNLISEGMRLSAPRTLVGLAIGLALIVLAKLALRHHEALEVASLSGESARKAVLVLGVMTAHSFAEGLGVGVSFGGEAGLGTIITTAIAIHNIPEGLAICLVMIPRGTPIGKAALWSIFSSLPQPLMAVPAFLFVRAFEPLLPIGLGIAAGAMMWMVIAEILPDALASAPGQSVGVAATLAAIVFWAFQILVLGH